MITKTQDNILLKMSQGWALIHVLIGSSSFTELRKGDDSVPVRRSTFEALSKNRLVCPDAFGTPQWQNTYKLTERGQQIVAVMVTGSNIVAATITGSKMGSHREFGNGEGI